MLHTCARHMYEVVAVPLSHVGVDTWIALCLGAYVEERSCALVVGDSYDVHRSHRKSVRISYVLTTVSCMLITV